MRCNGLLIPGSDSGCFCPTRKAIPDPFPRFSKAAYPSRINFRSFRLNSTTREATETDLSFYDLLGIPASVTVPEIKQAYKQLARKYHPDVSPPDRVEEYTQRFIRVQEAYETLSDPSRKALYDRDMAKGIHLAFSARRRFQNDMEMDERDEWKNRWQVQLSGLKRRNMSSDGRGGNMSWGARMRQQRDEFYSDT